MKRHPKAPEKRKNISVKESTHLRLKKALLKHPECKTMDDLLSRAKF